MRILIVGAGAVGQVYGLHLQQAGHEVAVYVRPKHVEKCKKGLPLVRLYRKRTAEYVFTPSEVLTTAEEIAAGKFDQVWLCTSTTPLLGGQLDAVISAAADTVLVSLQPGYRVKGYLVARHPEERLVTGLISMVSYPRPLPTEPQELSGIAYWLPPLVPSQFTGPREVTDAIVAALKESGCSAKRHKDAAASAAFGSAVLMPILVALQGEDWNFRKLRRWGSLLTHGTRGARQALVVVGKAIGRRAPLSRGLIRGPLFRFVLRLSPWFVPLDLEAYFKLHFTKVLDQTELLMAGYLEEAQKHTLPCDALSHLTQTVLGSSSGTEEPI